MKRSVIASACALALALLVAAPATGLAASTKADAPAPKTASAKRDEPSAAERRRAGSKFEREPLDQRPFAESDRKASKDSDGGSKEGSGGSIARAIFGLLVVLATIYGVHWLLKKWGQSRMQGVAGRSGIIDVVATTPLAQGRALHLVRVGDELVLVGATEQSITRLGEVDASLVSSVAGDRGAAEFQSMLQGAMYSQQPGVPGGASSDPFLKRFLDNLRMSTAR